MHRNARYLSRSNFSRYIRDVDAAQDGILCDLKTEMTN